MAKKLINGNWQFYCKLDFFSGRKVGVIAGIMAVLLAAGCAGTSSTLMIKNSSKTYRAGTIIDTTRGVAISFDALIADLAQTDIVYVGESHRNPHHHGVQLKVMQALAALRPNLTVAMEMFDRTYQPVLDQWSTGELDQTQFLQKTHWYANWRYDSSLYMDLLDFVKANRLRLVGLNIPFHIPPKISIGGIDSLSLHERQYLPAKIDLANAGHRDYVKEIFGRHKIRGRDSFGFFYQAQCAWDDGMAEMIAAQRQDRMMVVFLGNGHIIYKFGVPDRVAQRIDALSKTIFPCAAGRGVDPAVADYIWVTPATPRGHSHPERM
jgi:uncharacterized iron-regulated protein